MNSTTHDESCCSLDCDCGAGARYFLALFARYQGDGERFDRVMAACSPEERINVLRMTDGMDGAADDAIDRVTTMLERSALATVRGGE